MLANMVKDETLYSDAETEQRREAALKRMLNTPHTKHASFKAKQSDKAKSSRVSRTKKAAKR
jgi:hypothetical protein